MLDILQGSAVTQTMLGRLPVYMPRLQISYSVGLYMPKYESRPVRCFRLHIGVKVADIPAHVGVHGEPQAGPCVREDFTGRHRPCAEQRLRVSHGVDND